jgi:hypothetical protein
MNAGIRRDRLCQRFFTLTYKSIMANTNCVASQPDFPICLVCGEAILGVYVAARVDDCKPRNTPSRWRTVGNLHEHCESRFYKIQHMYTKPKPKEPKQ